MKGLSFWSGGLLSISRAGVVIPSTRCKNQGLSFTIRGPNPQMEGIWVCLLVEGAVFGRGPEWLAVLEPTWQIRSSIFSGSPEKPQRYPELPELASMGGLPSGLRVDHSRSSFCPRRHRELGCDCLRNPVEKLLPG